TFALVKGGAPVTIEEVALALAQPGIAKTSFWMLYKPEARAKKGAETAALTIATSLRNNAFLPGFNEAAQAALHTLEDAAADIATTDIVPAYAPPPVVKSDKL